MRSPSAYIRAKSRTVRRAGPLGVALTGRGSPVGARPRQSAPPRRGRPAPRPRGRGSVRRPRASARSGRASSVPSAARIVTRLVAVPKPDPSSATSLATSRSTRFLASFSAARARLPVSAAKPTSTGRGSSGRRVGAPASSSPRTRRPISASRSGFATSSSVSPASVRDSLRSTGADGRKSATAAAMTRASKPAPPPGASSRRRRAARIEPAVSARTISTPSGSGTLTIAATRVTRAPRSRAASATATPIVPVLRLPM